jgi:hypothetical protein
VTLGTPIRRTRNAELTDSSGQETEMPSSGEDDGHA